MPESKPLKLAKKDRARERARLIAAGAAAAMAAGVPLLLDEHAAAAALGVTVRCVQVWRFTGGGPAFVRVGRLVRYRPQDLTTFTSSNLWATTRDRQKTDPETAPLRVPSQKPLPKSAKTKRPGRRVRPVYGARG